ncbi:MAG: hypothetical protein M3O64_06840 [Chloroflexota bacterium]|nr:hypothetical protein [Chloroflexota bacterium]
MTHVRAWLAYVPAAIALGIVATLVSPLNDRFQFWFAGHLVATGGSPYDQVAWGAAAGRYGDAAALVARNCADPFSASCTWAYPPWTAWLYAPFGLLEPDRGLPAIAAATLLCGAVSVVLLTRAVPLSAPSTMVVALVAVGGAPFVWDSFVGHFEPALLIGALLLARGLGNGRTLPFVAGAVLLSLKPNLIVALVPLVGGVLLVGRRWRALVATAVVMTALALIGLWREPAAIAALSGSMAKTAIVLPTTWSFAARTISGAAPVVALSLVGISITSAWVAVRSAQPEERALVLVASGLALSLVVTPYAHLYDYVLLLPAIATTIALLDRLGRAARMIGWVVIGFGYVAITWLAFLGGPHGDEPAASALIPVSSLVMLAVVSAGTLASGRNASFRMRRAHATTPR